VNELTLSADLEVAVRLMREHAAKTGPLHSWWDYIFVFEGHLREYRVRNNLVDPANYYPELEVAIRIAAQSHDGQLEESTGEPYIRHVFRVVSLVKSPRAKIVAWLHDVLEDSRLTPADLSARGISMRVISSVVVLTNTKTHTNPEHTYAQYMQYIQRVKDSGDPIAVEVKIADLRDHFRPGCPLRLRPRYEAAWEVLCPGVMVPWQGVVGDR
jgi:hypothetical protein